MTACAGTCSFQHFFSSAHCELLQDTCMCASSLLEGKSTNMTGPIAEVC